MLDPPVSVPGMGDAPLGGLVDQFSVEELVSDFFMLHVNSHCNRDSVQCVVCRGFHRRSPSGVTH